jgi:ribonuclease HII
VIDFLPHSPISRDVPDLSHEHAAQALGHALVCGVDEAGRGPLAGPVSVAAVILPPHFSLPGLDDSKKLSAKKRELLFAALVDHPDVRWAQVEVDAATIDSLNILRATHHGMAAAVRALEEKYQLTVHHCLIDGLPVKHFPYSHEGIVKGDSKSLSIAAASIIAKVSRDRSMQQYAQEFPQYGFDRHSGYGTKDHLHALHLHGPCRIHRRSFQPVAQLSLPFDAP